MSELPEIPGCQQGWETWMRDYRGLADTSVRLYQRTLRDITRELGPPEQLKHQALRLWVERSGGAPGTKANRISALKSFFKYLVKSEQRDDNPAADLEPPKQRKGMPKPVEDLPKVLLLADEQDKKVYGRKQGETRAMVILLAETGLRISEACNLNVRIPAPAEIMVLGKGNKERLVPLTSRAREALDFLDGGIPIGARAVQRRFEKLGIHPHKLRHTRATTMIASGSDIGDVQQVLGHASPATTLIYAQFKTDRLREAMERADGGEATGLEETA